METLMTLALAREDLEDLDDRCVDGCGAARRRWRYVRVVRWPRVLLLHLKRFEVVSLAPYAVRKVETPVAFQPVMALEHGAVLYRLRALVQHHGPQARGGHYTAYG